MKRLPLATALSLTLSFSAFANDCVSNKGRLDDQMSYGSSDQIVDLQSSITSGCSVIGRAWSPIAGVQKFLVLDVDAGALVRITVDQTGNPSWETWSGFTENDIFSDDPADGYDLSNYNVEQGDLTIANRVVTENIKATIEALVARIQ